MGFFYTNKGVYTLLIITNVLWGANSVTAKFAVSELAPVTTAFLRFAGVSILLGIAVWLSEGKRALPSWKQVPGLVMLGVTGIFLNNVFFFSGIQHTTAANASLLVGGGPVFTAVLSAIFLKDRLTLRQLFGIGVSFIGVGIVVAKGSWEVIAGLSFNRGDLLLVMGSFSWCVYSILGRKVMRQMSALVVTAWSSAVGSVCLLILAVWQGFDGTVHLSPIGWGSMVFMIIGSGLLAFYFWNHGVSVVGPNRAAIFINLIPLSGMFFAALLLGETLTFAQFAGAGLIIGGVWLTTANAGTKHTENPPGQGC